MPTSSVLLTFLVATAAILVVPGPSVAYVVARSLEGGRAAGLCSVLGLETGALLHVAAASVGLAALVASSPTAFHALRFAGAGYLVWLGIRQLRAAGRVAAEAAVVRRPPVPRRRLFRDGVLVDLLNPKTTLFFVAFLPQFVDPGRGPAAVQVLVLGACFVGLALVVDSSYALTAARLARGVDVRSALRSRIDRGTGVVYLGLAGLTVLA